MQAWASGRIPACSSETNLTPGPTGGAGPLGLGCAMADPAFADIQEKPLSVLWFVRLLLPAITTTGALLNHSPLTSLERPAFRRC